jgi:hypothetical protein
MNKSEKTEQIIILIKKAHNVQIKEDYFNAYGAWDDVVTELNTLLESAAASAKLIKVASLASMIFTFGLGPEDLIMVPLLNKALFKLFKIDVEFITGRMNQALRMRQTCLYHEPKLYDVTNFLEEITYFTYSYKIANEVQSSSEKIKNFLNLINPLHKVDSLKFVKSEIELLEEINEIIESGRISPEMRTLNKSLKKYLEGMDRTKNMLYETLVNLV